jgi:hypothetical protein
MTAKSRSQIIGEIEDYIDKNGGSFGQWFVGCTGAPKAMLFSQHGVKQSGDAWIARQAKDDLDAFDVVEYFVATKRTKGRAKERRDTDLYVYAFKVKSHTRI